MITPARCSASAAETMDRKVLDGIELHGDVNVDDAGILANIAHSVRLGFPQVRLDALKKERVLLVGSGPSLAQTERELRDAYFAGGKVFTLNGAYQIGAVER